MQLIVTHDMTDFDALAAAVAAQKLHPGAAIALGRRVGKEVRGYLALHKDRFVTLLHSEIDPELVRHLIVVDVRRKSRLRDFARLVERAELGEIEVTVYDHHPADDDDLRADRAVIEAVGSATTLLVEQMDAEDVVVDEVEATLLALGIHADTGSLNYAGTTARDARALGWLLDQGASLAVMSRYLEPAFTGAQRALLAELLGAVEVEHVGHLDIAFVHRTMPRAVEGFAEVITEIAELTGHAAVFAVFGIAGKRVQVVARSRSPLVDAGALVSAVGGGGHHGAASGALKREDSLAVLEELRAAVRANPPQARRISDLMSSPVRTVSSTTTLRELARSLTSWRHTGVPVMKDGQIVGIVSRRDIAKATRNDSLSLPVSGVMTHKVHTVDSEEAPERALSLMQSQDVGRLPVLRDGRLVGIVTRSDLRRMLYGESSRPRQD